MMGRSHSGEPRWLSRMELVRVRLDAQVAEGRKIARWVSNNPISVGLRDEAFLYNTRRTVRR